MVMLVVVGEGIVMVIIGGMGSCGMWYVRDGDRYGGGVGDSYSGVGCGGYGHGVNAC